jgi:LEA14-like dessication related protein
LIIGARRAVLVAAIAAVALTIIFYPLIVATPIDLDKVDVKLAKVELLHNNNTAAHSLNMKVTFNITNSNPFTLTTSQINYQLFADGVDLGTHTLSYEDVPVTGRPVLFNGTRTPVQDTAVTIDYSDAKAQIFNKIQNNIFDIKWSATGTASIESGTTQVTKDFSNTLQ